MAEKAELIDMAVEIVSAYVGHNKISSDELSGLIHTVFGALTDAALGEVVSTAPSADPAVPVRKSVTPDYLICLEDGKRFKSLKRHLRTQYDLSPEEYRAKWDLPGNHCGRNAAENEPVRSCPCIAAHTAARFPQERFGVEPGFPSLVRMSR